MLNPVTIPTTAVPRFDRLMNNTQVYARWKSTVAGQYGFQVREINNIQTYRAQIDYLSGMIDINTTHFTYVDLLHESRHLAQLKRTVKNGAVFVLMKQRHLRVMESVFERGAYEYEMRLAQRFGFSVAYQLFLKSQLAYYWTVSARNRFEASRTLRAIIRWY